MPPYYRLSLVTSIFSQGQVPIFSLDPIPSFYKWTFGGQLSPPPPASLSFLSLWIILIPIQTFSYFFHLKSKPLDLIFLSRWWHIPFLHSIKLLERIAPPFHSQKNSEHTLSQILPFTAQPKMFLSLGCRSGSLLSSISSQLSPSASFTY